MKNYSLNNDGAFSIQLRLNPTLIKNNGAISFWDSEPKAKLYNLTLVIEDVNNRFDGSIYIDSFSDVSNNDYLEVYKTLYNYTARSVQATPDRLFLISTFVRCRKRLQETAAILLKVKNDKNYQELTQMLSSIVTNTATFPFIVNIAIKILDIIKRYLGKIDDISLATATHYFSRSQGDFDKIGKFNFNKSTQNVDFYFELIIHDKELHTGIDDTSYFGPSYISNVSSSHCVKMY